MYAVFSRIEQLVRTGLLFVFDMHPPRSEWFQVNVQDSRFGLLFELHIPPPSVNASLSVNVQLMKVGIVKIMLVVLLENYIALVMVLKKI